MYTGPFSPDSLEQAVTDFIRSIARGEDACVDILDSEGEIIEKLKELPCSLEEFMSVNKSVNRVIRTVVNMQVLLQSGLECSEELLSEIMGLEDQDEPEE